MTSLFACPCTLPAWGRSRCEPIDSVRSRSDDEYRGARSRCVAATSDSRARSQCSRSCSSSSACSRTSSSEKPDLTPLTDADWTVERALQERIAVSRPGAMCRRRACLPAWSDVASADGCCSTRIFSSPPGELRRPSRALEEARLERLRPRSGCFPASGRVQHLEPRLRAGDHVPRDSLTVRCLERQLTGVYQGSTGLSSRVTVSHHQSRDSAGQSGLE